MPTNPPVVMPSRPPEGILPPQGDWPPAAPRTGLGLRAGPPAAAVRAATEVAGRGRRRGRANLSEPHRRAFQ